MKLLIKQGRVIDPANKVNALMDVLVEEGRIAKIAKTIREKADEVIDARGKIVCPGLIDMHVHAREPGFEAKETIATCTRAAARGGFTSIVVMPNTNPPTDNKVVLEYIQSKAEKQGIVNVFCTANITKKGKGNELANTGEQVDAGAVAITDDGMPVMSSGIMRKAMLYSTMFKIPILSHSEDLNCGDGAINEGQIATKLGLSSKPAIAEPIMIAREILLAEDTDSQIHFQHVSTRISCNLIKAAKLRGAKVTAETCPHYFSLSQEAVDNYNANAKMNPPLRTNRDVEIIKRALKEGIIDVIASDHAPHTIADKSKPFEQCANGIVGLETTVPLVMNNLVHTQAITLPQAIAKLTINPAKILRLNKGTLNIGADADITIIDMEREEIIDRDDFESKGKNTPFHGWALKGIPIMTIVKGKIVMRDRRIVV